MKIKIDWFSNCALCMPAIGFGLLLFAEFIVIGCEEPRWPRIGASVMMIALLIGIVMALICLILDRHNMRLRKIMLFAIISNMVIIFVVAAAAPSYGMPVIRGHRIKMLQKRLAMMPPLDDGRTPKKGDYMVIDLIGGTGASNYPVAHLTAMPLGGWTDEYKTTKLVLRKITKGTFTMGDRSTDYPGAEDVGLHTVELTKDFYIGVFEVTQRQWELVMGNRPSYFTNESCYASRPVECVSYYDIRETPLSVIDVDDPERPSRKDAGSDDPEVYWPSNNRVNKASFMGKLRVKTGLVTLDLPTEAQWEYACRAGTTTALNTGHNLNGREIDPHMDVAGRYAGNGCALYGRLRSVDTLGGSAKVGSYMPNGWGLYDMHGNVQEWCLDWYGVTQPSPETVTDPKGSASGSKRLTRGAYWYTKVYLYRSANRYNYYPDFRSGFVGFRVACNL